MADLELLRLEDPVERFGVDLMQDQYGLQGELGLAGALDRLEPPLELGLPGPGVDGVPSAAAGMAYRAPAIRSTSSIDGPYWVKA